MNNTSFGDFQESGSGENKIKKLENFCEEIKDNITPTSYGASLSFSLPTTNGSTPEELWLKSFLTSASKNIKFRESPRNVLRGFSVTDAISKNNKMLGLIYHDNKDNGDNEDLFEVSSRDIKPLKPKEVKTKYPEYNGYHREDKKYL